MDLIASLLASAIAFVASILGSLLAHDICISANRTCAQIIRKAAARLASADRQPREAEWMADLHDRRTVSEKYRHAIGCFLVAGKMRREATTLILVLNFQISGVGEVPLTLNLKSRILKPAFLQAASAKPKIISQTALVLGLLYLRFKLNRSAKASSDIGYERITAKRFTQSKICGAHLKLGREDLDLVKLFHLAVEALPNLMRQLGVKSPENIKSLTEPKSAP